MQKFSGIVFFSKMGTMIRIFGQMQDTIFLERQYIIYRLVQNTIPADMNLQMRRYQEYSKKNSLQSIQINHFICIFN